MKKTITTTELEAVTGITQRTIRDWCVKDPKLAFMRKGVWHVRLPQLAKRSSVDLATLHAVLNGDANWIKATDLAREAEVPRRTLAHWCLNRPGFARRLGNTWYVDLDSVPTTAADVEALKLWVPHKTTTIAVASTVASLTSTETSS